MRINRNYFTLDPKIREFKWHLRQGHPISYALNRLRWHWYPRLHYMARFPIHVDIESSASCNMKCPMCFRGRISTKHGLMGQELFRQVVDECAAHHLYSIKLSWRGEPLLNHNLPNFIAYAKEKGIKEVAFLTNGLILEKPLARELIKAGLDWISVSFDGLGETHERIRFPSKYEEAVERLRQVRQVRDELGGAKPLLKVQTIWSAIMDDPDSYMKVWAPIVDRVMFIPDKDFYGEIIHNPDYVCQYPFQRLTITWDGKVPLCIGDTNQMYVVGDVNESTLARIWHGERMQFARVLHLQKRRLEIPCCRECPEGRIKTVVHGRQIPKELGHRRASP